MSSRTEHRPCRHKHPRGIWRATMIQVDAIAIALMDALARSHFFFAHAALGIQGVETEHDLLNEHPHLVAQ